MFACLTCLHVCILGSFLNHLQVETQRPTVRKTQHRRGDSHEKAAEMSSIPAAPNPGSELTGVDWARRCGNTTVQASYCSWLIMGIWKIPSRSLLQSITDRDAVRCQA
ncbi:hypothetical protein ASPZODRAFT_1299375 [Penicilliopsis zonata CBS 506.65]|uniref:Secreted protein n=1 Tax=Penicilliopsis zonata CBS 506.65 TaxID=1073090 RepID=A0A1L9S6F0_9EURO|nr:hypothetical protein ASPZODRAFT_1299375 [Penicilliopsis zonata CBS 506.65]OJJ42746.1 hypothetical protein ASPZODRAFT_1299375 [Penicilliopsis zonata CBS 506.65]